MIPFFHEENSPQGRQALFNLSKAQSPAHVESAIAGLSPDFHKIGILINKDISKDVFEAAARAIAGSHVQNVKYMYFTHEAKQGFKESLSVFTESTKHFTEFEYMDHSIGGSQFCFHIKQLFNVLKNQISIDTLKLECWESASVKVLADGIPEARNLRGLHLAANTFKKSDFMELKKAIERNESIQELTAEPVLMHRKFGCHQLIASLQPHLAKNARNNHFHDLFQTDRLNHFLSGRKGHRFISSFLQKVNLTEGSDNKGASTSIPAGHAQMMAKNMAEFISPADAINMALTNKATLNAATTADLSYAEASALRSIYQSSAQFVPENEDSKPAAVERPGKRQKP